MKFRALLGQRARTLTTNIHGFRSSKLVAATLCANSQGRERERESERERERKKKKRKRKREREREKKKERERDEQIKREERRKK